MGPRARSLSHGPSAVWGRVPLAARGSSGHRQAGLPAAGRGCLSGHPAPLRVLTLPASEGRPPEDAGWLWLPPPPGDTEGTAVGQVPVSLRDAKPKPESLRHLSASSGDAENAQRAFWTTGRQNLQTWGGGGRRTAIQETPAPEKYPGTTASEFHHLFFFIFY